MPERASVRLIKLPSNSQFTMWQVQWQPCYWGWDICWNTEHTKIHLNWCDSWFLIEMYIFVAQTKIGVVQMCTWGEIQWKLIIKQWNMESILKALIYIYFRQLPFYHADRDEYCRHASSKRLVKCVYCLGSFSLHPQFWVCNVVTKIKPSVNWGNVAQTKSWTNLPHMK